MILTAHQPAYLPWLGYFDKIQRSDVFVYLDGVQFEKNSYINRNKIKTPNGPAWLTVPVLTKGHMSSSLKETKINYSDKWKSKHLKSIAQNYRKAAAYETKYPKLEALYQAEPPHLSDLCFQHLEFWLGELGIKTKVVKQSEIRIDSKKSDLVFDLCQHFKATKYISGALGKDYLDVNKFKDAGIEVEFQDYQHPTYKQLYGEFASHMGIIDFWLNANSPELLSGASV